MTLTCPVCGRTFVGSEPDRYCPACEEAIEDEKRDRPVEREEE